MRSRKQNSQGGFVTMEIVLAAVLFVAYISAAISLLWFEQALAVSTQMQQQAQLLGNYEMENARVILKTNFFANIDRHFSSGDFSVNTRGEFLTNWVKQITITIDWPSAALIGQSYELKTQIYDKSQMAEADSCNTFLTGDWQHPQVLPGSIDLGTGIKATGIDVKNNLAYITADSSSLGNADFFIVDVADVNHPVIKSSISTGYGLFGVKVVGNYAYVLNASIHGQLQVINVSNSSHPILKAVFELPSNNQFPVSIAASNGKVYLGTKVSTGEEMYIINIANPLLPQWLGSFETGTQVNGIAVLNNVAYIATPNQQQVRLLNVSDPNNITQLSSFSPPGFSTQHGKSLYLKGDRLFFGKSGLNSPQNTNPKLFSLDVVDPNINPVSLNSQNIGSTPNAIIERSGYLFVASNDIFKEFQVWKTDLSGIMSHIADLDLPSEPVAMGCEGETIFLAQDSPEALKIIRPVY